MRPRGNPAYFGLQHLERQCPRPQGDRLARPDALHVLLGRLKEAMRHLEEALTAVRRRPGPPPPPLAQVPLALAETYDRANEFAKSEPLHRDMLEQARKQFGPDNPHRQRAREPWT